MMVLGFERLALRACLATVAAVLIALPAGCQPPPAASPNVTETTAAPAEEPMTEVAQSETSPADSQPAEPAGESTELAPSETASAEASEKPDDKPESDAAATTELAAADAKTTSESAGASASSAGAKLAGRVTFDGTPPERRPINMTKDKKCIELHGGETVLDEAVLVADDGGVKNAFVYIRRGAPKKDYPVPDAVIKLDQKDCMYRPRVQGMLLGQKMSVSNSDPVTHNVRSFPIRSRPFNFGQPPGSEPRERIFDAPEREVEVQCDIHPWMHAFIFVMDHPFFCVTDDDGSYTIEGLPPGEYTVESWHEKFGRERQTVTVDEADMGDVNFTYKPS